MRVKSASVPDAVRQGLPTVWFNPEVSADAFRSLPISLADVNEANQRWMRFSPLLSDLFPELQHVGGRVDSPLIELKDGVRAKLLKGSVGRTLMKSDHALPLTGSIKARGGVYEVLVHAENVGRKLGLLEATDDCRRLGERDARAAFADRKIVVGSTGNLGYSVGMMARTLSFQAEVHMSSDAKSWKKDRLRRLGVSVVEHPSDYSSAVAGARRSSAESPSSYFVDDEDSRHLFLGYSVAALDLQAQLRVAQIEVNAKNPLVVYLPCGVGGAPGGICFGLKSLFGTAVKCVFVEPVASPCMLVQLACRQDRSVSVHEFGLDNRTEADGLAVAAASLFVAQTVRGLVDAIVTVRDDDLFHWAHELWQGCAARLEPSGAAGFAAVRPFWEASGRVDSNATHVIWTTGGAMLPDAEFAAVIQRGKELDGY